MKMINLLCKKWLQCLMIWVLFSVAITAVYSQSSLAGDVSNDGKADIIDALLIAKYVAGLNTPTMNISIADVNCDGIISILDALQIARYVATILPALACSPTPTPTLVCNPCMQPWTVHVQDRVSNKPIAGVSAEVRTLVYGDTATALTDTYGNAELNIHSCGRSENTNFLLTKSGYKPYNFLFQFSEKPDCSRSVYISFGLELEPTPPPCANCDMIVSGRVTDIEGKPIAGAIIGTPSKQDCCPTDADGYYTIVISAYPASCINGDYLFSASAPGYAESRDSSLTGGRCSAITRNFILHTL